MSPEFVGVLLAVVASGVSTIIAVLVTHRSTQKILTRIDCAIEKLVKNSEGHTCILTKLAKASEEHTEILKRLARVAHTTEHTLAKVAFFGKTNILLQGWEIGDNVESREAAEKLGKVANYDPELGMCVYKPRGKRNATN
jgi:hypothetical protein